MGIVNSLERAMKNLTVKQVHNACRKHKYLLFRLENGEKVGINGKIADIARKRYHLHGQKPTKYVGFTPCTFHEYITHKYPFVEV